MNVQWDPEKDRENRQKHGISFQEAQAAFEDENRIILEDAQHSQQEKRYFCIGNIAQGIVTVRFTYRASLIRIFGAGLWRRGEKIYEEKNSNLY